MDEDLTQDHDSSDIEDAMKILDDSDDLQDVNAAPSDDEAPRDAGRNDTDVLNTSATFATAPLQANNHSSGIARTSTGSAGSSSTAKGKRRAGASKSDRATRSHKKAVE